MAITIDWPSAIINVPRADLTLIQSTPVEIRELNLETFRAILNDLQDSEEGMPWPTTHEHYTTVNVGGVQLAHVLILLDPYTITFEDGQYAVNLVGANSNAGDRVNVNQVSVRSANSAGLVQTREIEYASFGGGITLDQLNGFSGTLYPTGTPQRPVNNLVDAMLIANVRGFTTLFIKGNATIDGSASLAEMRLQGESPIRSAITILDAADVLDCEILDCTISGILDGGTSIKNCFIENLEYVNGTIYDSGIKGNIILNGFEDAVLVNCYTMDMEAVSSIDMNETGQNLMMPNYSGAILIKNLIEPMKVSIGLNSGKVILDSTIISGTIVVSGVGLLEDHSVNADVNRDGLLNRQLIVEGSWDEVEVDSDSLISGTDFPAGTIGYPVNNLADAILIAERQGILKLFIHGSFTLSVDLENYMVASNSSEHTFLNFNGHSVANSMFSNITLRGNSTGIYSAEKCVFDSGSTGIQGHFDDCIFSGVMTIALGGILDGDRCTFPYGSVFDLNTEAVLNLGNVSGVLQVRNGSSVNCRLGINGMYLLTLENTLTAGQALIAGIGILVNNSAGMTVTERTLPASVWADSEALVVRKMLANKVVKVGDIITIYDDDGVTPWRQYDLASGGRVPV